MIDGITMEQCDAIFVQEWVRILEECVVKCAG